MSRNFVLSFVEIFPLSVETEADSATEVKIPRVCSVPEFGFILGAVVRFHDGPDILLTVIGGGQGSTGRLWKQQTRENRKYATAQLETAGGKPVRDIHRCIEAEGHKEWRSLHGVQDTIRGSSHGTHQGPSHILNEAEQGSCLTRRFAEGRDEFPVNGRAQHSFEVSDSDDGLQIRLMGSAKMLIEGAAAPRAPQAILLMGQRQGRVAAWDQ